MLLKTIVSSMYVLYVEQVVQKVECCYSKPQVMMLFGHILTKMFLTFVCIYMYIRFILVLWNVFS